ncbi:hypothetical protein ACTA71_010020 [Dictyostelium dimigraforme]
MSIKSPNIFILSFLINIFVLILFFKNINCSIIQSYNQTGNRIDIQLKEPLFKVNITSLGNPLYENAVSTLNSCLFNTSAISIDLTKFKGVVNRIKNTGYDDFVFTLCDIVKKDYQSYAYDVPYGIPETETFKLGRYGIDDYALKLSYASLKLWFCYTTSTITFYCSENDDFRIHYHDPPTTQCAYDIEIDSKHVCPYRNVKLMKSNYYLTQPNIVSILLDENSTTTFFFNNGSFIENLLIKPIVYSIENDDYQIIVNGLFFVNMKSQYQFYMEGLFLDIISINSTTALLNCTNFMDNRFLVRLGEDYPFGISGPFSFSKSTNNFNVSLMMYQNDKYATILECSSCIGSVVEGIIEYNNYSIFIDNSTFSIVNENNRYIEKGGGGIYLRSLYPPYKTSNIIWNPPSSIESYDIRNENFQFSGGKQTIQGYFITPSIVIGKLSFLNGTDVILKYQVLNNFIKTKGIFIIPPGYGSGNFSIYLNDQLVNSTLFNYVPPDSSSSWIKSMKQDKEKIQLTLTFDLNPDFNITNIKYSNGLSLDYQIINQNIIQFNLSSYSTNQITFNDNIHKETLKNFEHFIYNYSIIENDIVEINSLFLSKDMAYYNFSMGTLLIDQMNRILYFDNYKIKINIKYYADNNLILTLYGSNISIPIVGRNQEDTQVYIQQSNSDDDDDDGYFIYCHDNCAGIEVYGFIINGESTIIKFSFNNFSSGIFNIGPFNLKSTSINTETWITYKTPLNNTTIVLLLPQPTFDYFNSQDGLYSMTNFEDYEFEVGGNFLYTIYNNSQFCKMSFNFNNGTVYEFTEDNVISKSNSLNRYYKLKAPYANGDGNFTVNYFDSTNNNNQMILLKSIPFKYPVGLLVVHSISNVEPNLPNSKLSIIADGIFSLPLIQLKIGPDGNTFNCDNITAIGLSSKGTIVNCNFNSTSLTTPKQFNQKIYITINNGQDHNLETSFSQCLTCINTDSSNSKINSSDKIIIYNNYLLLLLPFIIIITIFNF